MTKTYTQQFIDSSEKVGTVVKQVDTLEAAAAYIGQTVSGTTLVPQTHLAEQFHLTELLQQAGVEVFAGPFRDAGQIVGGGVTFSNFCLADSGTVVLDSTAEEIRLATTLPEKHFILVDPRTILADNLAAVEPMTQLHLGHEPRFVAYISGPSRTADIERVLTIGCHGPREVHILLVNDISDNLLEC